MTDKAKENSLEKNQNLLTDEQKFEAEFIKTLIDIFRNADLSKLDMRTNVFVGSRVGTEDEHREHNVLVDNYEISVRRTPVYAYPKKWNQIFCIGKWIFEPNKYERYQLDINENRYSERRADYAHQYYSSAQLGNKIMSAGTMATGLGHYVTSRAATGITADAFDNLYMFQNSHLFDSVRELYFILDAEYSRRQNIKHRHNIPNVYTSEHRAAARARMLSYIKTKLK